MIDKNIANAIGKEAANVKRALNSITDTLDDISAIAQEEANRKANAENAAISTEKLLREMLNRLDDTKKATVQTEKHFDNLHSLLSDNEVKQSQKDKKDSLRYWITTFIAIAALITGVSALILGIL